MLKLSQEQKKQISQLYMKHFVPLLIYAKNVLEDQDAAEEAVQETFRIACTRADQLLSGPNPEQWLIVTLKNTLRNHKRIFSRFRRIFSPLSLDDELDIAAEPPNELAILIQSALSPEEYELYYQVIIRGESFSRVAQKKGISTDACRKRVNRIREKLQQLFEE